MTQLATDLLAAVRARVPEVDGLTILDVNDSRTWRFDGDLTTAQRLTATAALHAQVTPPAPSVAQYWPIPLTPVEHDVRRILDHLELSTGDPS